MKPPIDPAAIDRSPNNIFNEKSGKLIEMNIQGDVAMGFLEIIKKLYSPSSPNTVEKQIATQPSPAPNQVSKRSEYHTFIKKPLFKQVQSFPVQVETEDTWDTFF